MWVLLAYFVYSFQTCLDHSALALPPTSEASASLAICSYFSWSSVKPCSCTNTELFVGRKLNLLCCLGNRGQLSSQLLQWVYQKMPRTLCCRTRRVLGWKLSQIIPKFQFMLATFWIQVSPVWDKTHMSTITPSLFALMTYKDRRAKGSHVTHCTLSLVCVTRTAPQ